MFAEAVTNTAWIGNLLWLIPLPPILAFALIALFANRSRTWTTTIAMTGIMLSLVLSWIVVFNVIGEHELGKHPIRSVIPWLATGDTTFNIGVGVDPIGATFLFMVPLACTLIFLYSTGYMAHDVRYTRFMAYLSLFAGSMMGLVVSDNLLLLFVFWELMGFCSYSLIGFFYFKQSAYKAAVKAFMTTRVGDMLLILGMVYLYSLTGTLSFHETMHNEEVLKSLAATPAAFGLGISAAGLVLLLIFGGTVGKSAQWPLHVWLPDAMEGPTPVSAMIHAATMVSAGIFMLLRFFPLWQTVHHYHDSSYLVIGLIGAFTAFMGATIALAQFDIKRVLAFSTISQLGFMVAAIGIGAYIAAAFHLLTHAFFKALLFLGSGSVIHGVEHGHEHVSGHHEHGDPAREGLDDHGHASDTAHSTRASEHHEPFDPQDMRNMGGLARRMPVTFITFLIGGLALAGFPFITAGFWSKDEIFADAWNVFAKEGNWLGLLVFVTLAVSALMTAFYTMRQIAMTFFGKPRTEAAAHAGEQPWTMTLPLVVLSFFALFAGFANIPKDFPAFGLLAGENAHWLGHFLESQLIETHEAPAFNLIPVLASLAVALIGLFAGWWVYGRRPLQAGQKDPVQNLRVFDFLHNRWYWDELYRKIFINPLQSFADNYSRLFDKGVLDKILEGVYGGGGVVASVFKQFDKDVVTGTSNAIGRAFASVGGFLRELQSGQIQGYLLSGLGMILLIVLMFVFVFN